jgi:hypothetical protein
MAKAGEKKKKAAGKTLRSNGIKKTKARKTVKKISTKKADNKPKQGSQE